MDTKEQKITRDELYKLAWSMPFRKGKQIPTFLEIVRTVLMKRQSAE